MVQLYISLKEYFLDFGLVLLSQQMMHVMPLTSYFRHFPLNRGFEVRMVHGFVRIVARFLLSF